jgi:hypothetical protein
MEETNGELIECFFSAHVWQQEKATRFSARANQAGRMDDKCIWVVFQAQPTLSPEGEFLHPNHYGTFACKASQPDPLHLLDAELAALNLVRFDQGPNLEMSMDKDWGLSEPLKAQIEQRGFGLSLVKMHFPTR